jgi:hypothetical protein
VVQDQVGGHGFFPDPQHISTARFVLNSIRKHVPNDAALLEPRVNPEPGIADLLAEGRLLQFE